MGDGGKGSGRRPTLVDDKELADNWARIFGNKEKSKPVIIESKETPLEREDVPTTTNSESPLWTAGAVYRKE